MPAQIRIGIFETNSSSCHSISFGERWPQIDHANVPACPLTLTGGEFGWGPSTHRSFHDKANYAYTYARMTEARESERGGEMLAMLQDVILEATGYLPVLAGMPEYKDDPDWEHGYIDHQSFRDMHDIGMEFFANPESLRAFIFDPSTILVINNDNM